MAEPAAERILTVERLGAQGDGVAETEDGPVFVPLSLPGERWRAGQGGYELLSADARRQVPICRHFGRCGGCVAQHMPADLYRTWKEGSLRQALAQRGIMATIEPLRMVAPRSRRRAFFGMARRGDAIVLGFREQGRHTLVDLAECPVLDPVIVAALPSLRELARLALPPDTGGRLIVTRADNGLDVSIDGSGTKLDADSAAALAGHAAASDLQRLIVEGSLLYLRQAPSLAFCGVPVELPPASFLQAVPEAEALLSERVGAAAGKAKVVADLFCGLGTFTFRLARKARVLATDSDRRSIEALAKAARAAQGLKPIEARVRDLMREPLSRTELREVECAVANPPRSGAKAQAEALARSGVPRVVMVSCNPATFARDARILVDGGYRLGTVTPIDQFLFSPHLELVADFSR